MKTQKLLTLSLLVIISLTSCNNNDDITSSNNTTTTTSTSTTTTTSNTTSDIIDLRGDLINVLKENNLSYKSTLTETIKTQATGNTYKTSYNLAGHISSNRYYLQIEDNIIYDFFKDSLGRAVVKKLDPITNETKDTFTSSIAIMFDAQFKNPLTSIEKEDLNVIDSNTISYKLNKNDGIQIGRIFANDDFEFEDTSFIFDDNKNLTNIEFSYSVEGYDLIYGNNTTTYTLNLNLISIEELNLPNPEPKKETENSAKLNDFLKLLQNGNYSFISKATSDNYLLHTYNGKLNSNGYMITYSSAGLDDEVFGYMQDENQIIPVNLVNNELVQTTFPLDGNVSQFKTLFNYNSNVFSYLNGIYNLEKGIGLYDQITNMLVEANIPDHEEIAIIDGSFNLVLNSNNTLIYTFTSSFDVGESEPLIVNYETTIYDINNTNLDYTLEDVLTLPLGASNWSEVKNASELLNHYKINQNILPFYNPNLDGYWISSGLDVEYPNLSIVLKNSNGYSKVIEYYKENLVNFGWQNYDNGASEELIYLYRDEENNLKYKIGLISSSTSFAIYFYEAQVLKSNVIEFIKNNFKNNVNYTIIGELNSYLTQVNISSDGSIIPIDGAEVEKRNNANFTLKYTNDAAYLACDGVFGEYLYINKEDIGYDKYEKLSDEETFNLIDSNNSKKYYDIGALYTLTRLANTDEDGYDYQLIDNDLNKIYTTHYWPIYILESFISDFGLSFGGYSINFMDATLILNEDNTLDIISICKTQASYFQETINDEVKYYTGYQEITYHIQDINNTQIDTTQLLK